MALSNRTSPEQAEQQLTTWLATKLPGAQDVRVFDAHVPADAGLSAETILFEASWTEDGAEQRRNLVARVRPSGAAVFPDYDFEVEFRAIEAVGRAGLPVPEALWYEQDTSGLGGEFIVMERLYGRVPTDDPPFTATGWVLELSPEQRATLCDNALKVLADIHAVDWRAAGLDLLDRRELGAPGLDQHLAYWENTFEWAADGEANPTVEAAFEWIRENRPAEDEPLVLNWGDARIGNMLFADDQSVAGVLDWEMVSLGSPELELGWWLFLLRHHTEGIGAPLPPGFPTRDETIARYEQLSGHQVRHIDFYEAFAALRLSILMHRAGHMMIAAGLLPPDAPMKLNNPASQLLAKLVGLPAPDGVAQSFIGNR
jgi:aminoglycoside phosphotransferase (APT) family kinase protein